MERKTQKIVKASFVGCNKDTYAFSNSSCILPISVGQHYHEGDALIATLELISNNFGGCMIMVCDSLQRHTLNLFQDGFDNDSHEYANKLGEEWIARNKNYIDKMSIPCELVRWDYWLNHQEYKKQKQSVEKAYKDDEKFRLAIHQSVNAFLKRSKKRMGEKFDYDKLLPVSLEYFKEECAIMPLWANKDIDYEIYPGQRPGAMMVAHEYFVKPEYLKWLNLRFRTKAMKS